MIKNTVKKVLKYFGLEIYRIEPTYHRTPKVDPNEPSSLDPVWPLPRRAGGPTDEEISAAFAKFESWHYEYSFEGGISFSARQKNPGPLTNDPRRSPQRFRHYMPYLIESQGGSLRGKKVLDIACNSGYWSIQCALLGADVVGFDARPELIEQANLVKSIVGLDNVEFRILDFWKMSPETLGGTFDVVLNLGVLYHLPNPIEVIELTRSMAKDRILLDTAVFPIKGPLVRYLWEEPFDIRAAATTGIAAFPSKAALEMIFKHLGLKEWREIPIRTREMPDDYIYQSRASWLIKP